MYRFCRRVRRGDGHYRGGHRPSATSWIIQVSASRAAGQQRLSHPVTPRILDVRELRRITPRLLRVTLAGPQLAGFRTEAPTDHVKVFFPAQRGAEPVVRPGQAPGASRTYTIRAFTADPGQLDIDIVLHGDGAGTRWASEARTGDRVGVLGPRSSQIVPADLDWYLFAVDETGLPAAARWLGELRPGTHGMLLAEVADPGEELELSSPAEVTVAWRHRDGAGDRTLEQALRRVEWPPGDGFVWVAGETGAVTPIRRFLRDEAGLDPARVAVDGYWRRGVADYSHAAGDPSMHRADNYRGGPHPAIFTPEGQPGVRPVGRQ